ncbi:MAG: hypothetical protein FJ242_00820 [Nitrospira sp.]|nr:hypothetical protein [Nitrospira sp.]
MGKKKNDKKIKKEALKSDLTTPTKKLLTVLIMGSAIFFVCLIRLRFLEVPLERDEGEYAYMGQLLLQGILPYSEAYNMKFPGIYFIYAVILILFGKTHTGIHLALLFVNIATAIVLFLLGKQLFNNITGIITAVSFLIMTLSPSVQGLWANSEHFVMLLAIGGILLMVIATEKNNTKQLFLSGFLLGAAFLVKQNGILFLLFGIIYVCWNYFKKAPLRLRVFSIKVGLFILGVVTSFCILIIPFLVAGNFDKFWFWTFKYASEYVSLIPISSGIDNFKRSFMAIIKPNLSIVILSLFGLIGVIYNKAIRARWIFSYGLLIASFLSLCTGFYFRPHYYILFLPALSLHAGIGAYFIVKKLSFNKLQTVVALCIIVLSLVYPILTQKEFLFELSPVEACRLTYGLNPFPESLEVAKYINKYTEKNDRVAVLGSEPQIYFYSQRRAATGYLYTYPLMESHKFALQMQKEMINEIESNNPKYIVFVNIHSSWHISSHSVELLFMNWIPGFLRQGYRICGIVDIISPNTTIYKWGNEAISYHPRSMYFLVIYSKKNNLEN